MRQGGGGVWRLVEGDEGLLGVDKVGVQRLGCRCPRSRAVGSHPQERKDCNGLFKVWPCTLASLTLVLYSSSCFLQQTLTLTSTLALRAWQGCIGAGLRRVVEKLLAGVARVVFGCLQVRGHRCRHGWGDRACCWFHPHACKHKRDSLQLRQGLLFAGHALTLGFLW